MNKRDLKDKISSNIVDLLYESKKMFTTRSLKAYLYYEYYQKKEEQRKIKNRINQTIWRLKKAGLMKEGKQKKILLSKKGYLKYLFNKSKKINKKDKKDFYLIVFDISEEKRNIRNLLRKVLYNFGAEKLQKSVFIIRSEEECLFLRELINECDINNEVKIIKSFKIIN